MFNATFNNISVISLHAVSFIGGGIHRLAAVTDKLDHIMSYRVHLGMCWIRTLVVIGTDCICSCKSNYHTTAMPPRDLFGYLFWKICMTSLWERPFNYEIFADNVPVFVSYHPSFFRTMFCNSVIFLYFFQTIYGSFWFHLFYLCCWSLLW